MKDSPRPGPEPLDNFDRRILEILQRDNKTPQREIARAVNLSAPAVQRRIRRMEDARIILANTAMVDPVSVGLPITILVEVEMENEQAEKYDAVKRAFMATPEIQQCYYVTGECDFILVINVSTMTEYEALTRKLFFSNNNVKRFRTFVAMDRVKVGATIPIS